MDNTVGSLIYATQGIIMTSLHEVGGKVARTMGFALMVALLSFGAISGCDDGNDGNTGPAGAAGPAGPEGPPGSDGFDGLDGTGGGLGSEAPVADCVSEYCEATTTSYAQFGETWPAGAFSGSFLYGPERLKNDFTLVATPFPIQLAANGSSREAYMRAVINDAQCGRLDCTDSASVSQPMCYELEGAKQLLMPQEFCGGNAWNNSMSVAPPTAPGDVQNGCKGIVGAYAKGKAGIVNLCKNPDATCTSFCTLVNLVVNSAGKSEPQWLDVTKQSNMQAFINTGSCLPKPTNGTWVSPTAQQFTDRCVTPTSWVNWCTGATMHFDGLSGSNEKVRYKKVACNSNGSKVVGVLGKEPLPPDPPMPAKPDQLVIKYNSPSGKAAVSCEPAGGSPPTSIDAGSTGTVAGSETASKVTCYTKPNQVITHDIANRSWSSTEECVASTSIKGSYTCTVTY